MTTDPPSAPVGWTRGIARGLAMRCPACGEGRAFGRFLKVAHACEVCGLELHHHRADDLPPYVTIFIVAHIVGYGVLVSELHWEWPLAWHVALWPALTLLLALALMQPVKGAVVGLQYALGMHGFGRDGQRDEDGERAANDEREP